MRKFPGFAAGTLVQHCQVSPNRNLYLFAVRYHKILSHPFFDSMPKNCSYGAARGSQKTLLEGFLLMSVGVPALIAWMAVVVVGGSRDSVLGASALTVTSEFSPCLPWTDAVSMIVVWTRRYCHSPTALRARAVAYYGVPLSSMREVVRTRDASSILYPLTVTNTINASCWFVYGLFALHDPVVWAPNGVGVLLGMVQFTLRIIYGTQSAEVQILGQSSIKNVEDGSVSVLRETA